MAVRIVNRKTKKPKVNKTNVKIETVTSTSIEIPSSSSEVPSTSKEVPSTSSEVKKEIESQENSSVKKEIDTIPLSLPKFNPNKQARGHFGSAKRAFPTKLEQDPSYKKTKKDYSVAKDPQTSEVFKSLFTSHKNDKEQQRAHWVTYNPFYN